MATFVYRVQFLDDTDPFNSTNFPEPTRPPLFTFREDIPLINQIAGVHRLLKAPQKVGGCWTVAQSGELINNTDLQVPGGCKCSEMVSGMMVHAIDQL